MRAKSAACRRLQSRNLQSATDRDSAILLEGMTSTGRIGLLGGTFDPFHHGHLALALSAHAAFHLDVLHLIPAHVPPHRSPQPTASAEHRFAMVALGISNTTGLTADDRELHGEGPSYTSRTLASYSAQGWQASQIFFVTGADAFAEIATWHDYPAILERAHFVVGSRPGRDVLALRDELPDLAPRMRTTGEASPPPAEDTAVPAIWLVSAATPAVSASAIRRAVAEGRSITGMTPVLVEQHIVRHGLYGRTGHGLSPVAGPSGTASHLHEKEHV
jgi:nicotinate-nucleotide adenylyltransferase